MSGNGGIPLFLRVADGNEQDKVVFGEIAVEYQSIIDFETMIVADSALYPTFRTSVCHIKSSMKKHGFLDINTYHFLVT